MFLILIIGFYDIFIFKKDIFILIIGYFWIFLILKDLGFRV
jgi:hypothetical protein